MTADDNIIEHVMNQVFQIQNLLLKQSCVMTKKVNS
jgi:hypothetical protein